MLTICFLLTAVIVMAQQKVGEARVNDRMVHLYSDYTWKYIDYGSTGSTKKQGTARISSYPAATAASYSSSASSSSSSYSSGYCGALTKKGTPCRRKVNGGGRCWQH